MRNIGIETRKGITVLLVNSYFEEECGKELEETTDDLRSKGLKRVVIDFSRCPKVNSMGIGSLLESCTKIVNENHGHVVLCGMTQMMQKVFNMAGVLSLADDAESVDHAISLLEGDS